MAKLTTSKKNLYHRLEDLNFKVHKYKTSEEDDPLAEARKGGVFAKIKALIKEKSREARDNMQREDIN